ncbi:MAG: tetratricopeptide repeat protein [Flavobacteriales bacterium]|nr:tetratricopeptide repeat protein [Flavobacteriales bacterium]
MADNKTSGTPQDLSDKTEQFIENNSRNLTMAIGAVAVLIVAVVGYGKFVSEPAETEANENSWRAEQYFFMDSLDLALNGDGLYPGLYDIIDDHDGTKAAARARYELGTVLRSQGDYAGAIEAFGDAALNDDVLSVLAQVNIGDCQVELGDYSAAASAFNKAASASSSSIGENYLAPIALYKGALVDIELGDNSAAKSKLTRITEEYATSNVKATAEGLAATLIY